MSLFTRIFGGKAYQEEIDNIAALNAELLKELSVNDTRAAKSLEEIKRLEGLVIQGCDKAKQLTKALHAASEQISALTSERDAAIQQIEIMGQGVDAEVKRLTEEAKDKDDTIANLKIDKYSLIQEKNTIAAALKTQEDLVKAKEARIADLEDANRTNHETIAAMKNEAKVNDDLAANKIHFMNIHVKLSDEQLQKNSRAMAEIVAFVKHWGNAHQVVLDRDEEDILFDAACRIAYDQDYFMQAIGQSEEDPLQMIDAQV